MNDTTDHGAADSTIAPNADQKPAAGSKLRRWPALVGLLKLAAIPAVIAAVPLFIAFASTQLKDMFDRFFSGCVLVIEKELEADNQILVTARLAGKAPTLVPLMFQAHNAQINQLAFDDPYRRNTLDDPDDLTGHPMMKYTCPGSGEICEQEHEDSDTPFSAAWMLITMTDLHPEFVYLMHVRMNLDASHEKITEKSLHIYAQYDKGLDGGVCRVEPQRWHNFWVWAGPLKKSIVFLLIVVTGGLALSWAKKNGGVQS